MDTSLERRFSPRRFACVARWDLTVNRHFYLRSSLVVFIVMALPTLLAIPKLMSAAEYGWSLPSLVTTASTAASTISLYLTLLPFLVGYMLHNLLDRQGRIRELTLPATNLERFLWHVCLPVVGSLVVAVLSFVVLDVLHFIVFTSIVGPSMDGEFVNTMVRLRGSMSVIALESVSPTSFTVLLWLFFLSTMALGNAYRYHHNILFTLVADFLLAFVCGIAFAASALHSLYNMEFPSLRLWGVGIKVVLVVLIVACWMLAYRLYARATLTSGRNR